MRVKNKTTPDTWFFRYYEDQDGRRVHRNLKVGTVREVPLRRDAEKAVLTLRATINQGIRTPETVYDLVAHFQTHELTAERKSHATLENYGSNLKLHILPKWGQCRLSDVRTVAVEAWLHALEFAPATKTKIRNLTLPSERVAHRRTGFGLSSGLRLNLRGQAARASGEACACRSNCAGLR